MVSHMPSCHCAAQVADLSLPSGVRNQLSLRFAYRWFVGLRIDNFTCTGFIIQAHRTMQTMRHTAIKIFPSVEYPVS